MANLANGLWGERNGSRDMEQNISDWNCFIRIFSDGHYTREPEVGMINFSDRRPLIPYDMLPDPLHWPYPLRFVERCEEESLLSFDR